MKDDHPPILAPGRHYICKSDIAKVFVQPFECELRSKIWKALMKMIAELEKRNIPCQIWLDGSFVTHKEKPTDLDISVQIDADVVDSLSEENINFIFSTLGHWSDRYLDVLDVYVHIHYPIGYDNPDPEKVGEMQEYADLWQLGHNKDWLKGIAIIRVLETHVGHIFNT